MNKNELVETPEILIPALRQYRHNNNSGLVHGLDHDETVKIFAHLTQQLEQRVKEMVVALGRDRDFLGEEYEAGYYQCRLELLEAVREVFKADP